MTKNRASSILLKFSFIVIALFIIGKVFGAEEVGIALENAHANINDRASILRGAKLFSNTCMVCHTLKYMTHNKLAESAGITADKMPLNQKEWTYGVVPPDLSLEARVRGANWIYTYLHSFYKDPSRPTGFNNLLVPNSAMMNMVSGMQGIQERANNHDIVASIVGDKAPHYYQVLKLVQSGSQSPEEFDESTRDLTNFLVYASDPHARERKNIGVYVLIFLAIFFVIVFLLKKIIWKNIK